MKEEWKIYIKNTKNVWEVSNKGNVKKNGKPYIPQLRGTKYLKFAGGNYVHKAVAELFIPNPEKKHDVDHIDTNRLNNCVENLRWSTRKENCRNPLSRSHYRKGQLGKIRTEEHKKHISEGLKRAYALGIR